VVNVAGILRDRMILNLDPVTGRCDPGALRGRLHRPPASAHWRALRIRTATTGHQLTSVAAMHGRGRTAQLRCGEMGIVGLSTRSRTHCSDTV